jgi:hypothetical protein
MWSQRSGDNVPLVECPEYRSPARRRRRPTSGRRSRQVVVRLSDDELAAVERRAAGAGLAVGAWVGETATSSAERAGWTLAMSRPEVVGQLVRLRLDAVLARQLVDELGPRPDDAVLIAPLDMLLQRLDELIDHAVDDEDP